MRINNWTRNIDGKFFHGNSRFSLTPESYKITLKEPHQALLFNPEYTNETLVLEALRNNQFRDSAFLGFNDENTHFDCKQIQGRQGSYRELAPVAWHRILLTSLIQLAKEQEKDSVMIVPSYVTQGYNCANAERLHLRYDINAQQAGFRLSDTFGRYVLDL